MPVTELVPWAGLRIRAPETVAVMDITIAGLEGASRRPGARELTGDRPWRVLASHPIHIW